MKKIHGKKPTQYLKERDQNHQALNVYQLHNLTKTIRWWTTWQRQEKLDAKSNLGKKNDNQLQASWTLSWIVIKPLVQNFEERKVEKDLLKSPQHLTKINQNWQTLNLHQLHQFHNLKRMPQDDEQLNKRRRNKMFISLGEISIPCNINILTNPLKFCHKIGCLSKHSFNFF